MPHLSADPIQRATSGVSSRASLVSAAAGASVATIGALVFLGWVLDIPSLKSIYGPITMKTNASLALLLAGIGLWSHAHGLRRLAILCAAVTGAIALLTLSQHLAGWDLGIDQLLFPEPAGAAATASPNRMGPNASASLTLASVALVLLTRGTRRAIRYAQWLGVVCLMMATLAIAGYVYGAAELYAVARYTGISLHTAISLLILHVGILAARADDGPMAAFLAEGPAGMLLRRLIAPVVLIPLLLGYLALRGRQGDLYDRGLGFALFGVSVVIVLGTIVWHTAKVIAESDARRRRAEQERDLLLERERRARGDAERANRLKDHFIAVLSHELRTPLNVMLGWTKLLEADGPAGRHRHAAAVVARNGRLLARLVEDLLDISRASAGQFEISPGPLSLNPVVQASLDAMLPAAAEKGIRVTADLDPALPLLEGDPERIQQVVSNLLSNAVKFTPAGGEIVVRTARSTGQATLTVADTGIGFDRAFASELFQPFRQADSSMRREFGGLGLGLSIARHIAELHGGSMRGQSDGPGTGATFTLTLPAPVTPSEPSEGGAPWTTVAPSPSPRHDAPLAGSGSV